MATQTRPEALLILAATKAQLMRHRTNLVSDRDWQLTQRYPETN